MMNDTVKVKKQLIKLSELPQGALAVIVEQERNDFSVILMEMGCVPGESVCVEMIAPMGDPMAIKISGYYLSIRKIDAGKVWVTLT